MIVARSDALNNPKVLPFPELPLPLPGCPLCRRLWEVHGLFRVQFQWPWQDS